VKKLFLVLMASLALGATPLMADKVVDSFAKPGDLTLQAGLGLAYYGFGIGFSVAPGVEYGLAQVKLSEQFPINFGASVRGFYSTYSYSTSYLGSSSDSIAWNYLGLGAFATAHYTLKYLKLGSDFWNHVDYYLALGLAFSSETPSGSWVDQWKKDNPGSHSWDSILWFGLSGYSGVAYHFDDRLAVYLEFDNFAYSASTILGVSYKL
jgi:hypothetical protein